MVGCSTQSTDDLYLERALCVSSGDECAELDLMVARREETIRRLDNAKSHCPRGYMAYCDESVRGCGQRLPRKPIQYVCVSPEQLRRTR